MIREISSTGEYVSDILPSSPLEYILGIKHWTRIDMPEGLATPIFLMDYIQLPTCECIDGFWKGAEVITQADNTTVNLQIYKNQLTWATQEIAIYTDMQDMGMDLSPIETKHLLDLKLYRIQLSQVRDQPNWPSQAIWPEIPTRE